MSPARLLRVVVGAGVVAISACAEDANYPVADDRYPADCVATNEPVFYNGAPNYWCDGRWYYREPGGQWAHYTREPDELYRHRVEAPTERHTEEHPAPVPRPPAPAPPPTPSPPAPRPPGGGEHPPHPPGQL